MIRKIIHIDEEKCNGCGACVTACHEGAIGLVNGKAKLMRDDYCDGFGDCLPHCPTGAITFVEREAAAYDEKAVEENKRQKAAAAQKPLGGCPGSAARSMFHQPVPQMHHGCPGSQMRQMQHKPEPAGEDMPVLRSQLSQWPVQIKLVPVNAPYFDGAKLLIAADCTAYAYANFHQKFIRGHITLVGCPKLDDVDYSEKLTEIILREAYNQECSNDNINGDTIRTVERPVEFLHAIIIQLSFFVANQCHLIVPRVNSLNRAFHLFLERFQRTVNVDHFRVMLWANPQNFHTVNLPNCTSKI